MPEGRQHDPARKTSRSAGTSPTPAASPRRPRAEAEHPTASDRDGIPYFLQRHPLTLEVFNDDLTEERLHARKGQNGDGSFDTLASARQLFAVNGRLAWLRINDFRKAAGLPRVIEPPDETAPVQLTG